MTYIRPELKNNEWNLTKHEFYTAYHYALQYREWKDMYKSIADLSAVTQDGMPHTNNISDTTYQKAVKLDGLGKKISLIENTVKETAPELYCWLLKGVTCENVSYVYLSQVMGIPCGKNYYYKARRKFYYNLSKKIEAK